MDIWKCSILSVSICALSAAEIFVFRSFFFVFRSMLTIQQSQTRLFNRSAEHADNLSVGKWFFLAKALFRQAFVHRRNSCLWTRQPNSWHFCSITIYNRKLTTRRHTIQPHTCISHGEYRTWAWHQPECAAVPTEWINAENNFVLALWKR